MYVIETKGYGPPEKLIISNNYIILSRANVEVNRDDVKFEEGVIDYMIEKHKG